MMDRRDFLKSVTAGGVLAGASASAGASILPADSPVLIVCQSDLPAAVELTGSIAGALRALGAAPATVAETGARLRSLSCIDALACGGADRIAGVMDDAAAVLFQEVAAARGYGTVARACHRFHVAGVRHHFHRTGMNGALAWSEPASGWHAHIARLYAEVLTGLPPRPIAGTASGRGLGTGLASFILNI